MTYKEGIEKCLNTKWKTTTCEEGEQCWCRIIEPVDKIVDDRNNVITVVNSGAIEKEFAEHIVRIHNYKLGYYDFN